MSDHNPSNGRFQKGHKINKKDPDIVDFEKEGGKKFLNKFDMFINMPLTQLKTYTEDLSKVTGLEAILIKFIQEAMKRGDVARLKLIMTRYGLPTELKAVAVQEFGDIMSGKDDERNPIELNDEQRKTMAKKYLALIESEDAE